MKNSIKITENYRLLKGIPSSPGVCVGRVVKFKNHISLAKIEKKSTNHELQLKKLKNAIFHCNKNLMNLLVENKDQSHVTIKIIESYSEILSDEYLISSIEKRINNGDTAEFAVISEFDHRKTFFLNANDALLRDRAIDIDNIKKSILEQLKKKVINLEIKDDSIVIADNLSPNQLINLRKMNLMGFATEVGGISSHSSILARSFELPSVIGVDSLLKNCNDNEIVIIDGFTGEVHLNPPFPIIKEFRQKIRNIEIYKQELGKLNQVEAITLDGVKISLCANIDFPEDIEKALIAGADGFGLVRTEMLLLSSKSMPSEEEQFKWYSKIAEMAYPKIAKIRVFDIGSDKFIEGLSQTEVNPALGLRGIRFLLKRKELFKIQLRALLRASANKNIKIMLPMVTRLEEIIESKKILESVKAELDENSILYDRSISLGIMAETPSSIRMADVFAQEIDFFSIGTNDLTQYVLATDRDNEFVRDLYDSFDPSIVRAMNDLIKSTKKFDVEIGICGELAGYPLAIPMILGLGIKEISVNSAILPEIKSTIRNLDMKQAIKIANKALKCINSQQIKKLLK